MRRKHSNSGYLVFVDLKHKLYFAFSSEDKLSSKSGEP